MWRPLMPQQPIMYRPKHVSDYYLKKKNTYCCWYYRSNNTRFPAPAESRQMPTNSCTTPLGVNTYLIKPFQTNSSLHIVMSETSFFLIQPVTSHCISCRKAQTCVFLADECVYYFPGVCWCSRHIPSSAHRRESSIWAVFKRIVHLQIGPVKGNRRVVCMSRVRVEESNFQSIHRRKKKKKG